MKIKRLGRSAVKVSEISLGTNNFGSSVPQEEINRIIDKSLELGVNFIDTADIYTQGRSEETLGNALKGKRDEFVLATKVASSVGQGPNDQGLSRKHIMQQVKRSLSRLQTDYIDLYICHFPDPDTPILETLKTLDDLVSAGKVNYIGCSNYGKWKLEEALETSRVHNLEAFISAQPRYNLLDRTVEADLLPFCRENQIGVTPYSPLVGGLLTGKYRSKEEMPPGSRGADSPWFKDRFMTEANMKKVAELQKIAEGTSLNLTQISLAWLLNNPAVTSVILGTRNAAQFEETIKNLPAQLPQDVISKVSRATQ